MTKFRKGEWRNDKGDAQEVRLISACHQLRKEHVWQGQPSTKRPDTGDTGLSIMQSWAMYEHERDIGEVASPEWFDDKYNI